MINKSTKESQSIAQISANTQPNNKATKLSKLEKNKIEKPIISLLQCEINISQLRPRIKDPTGQNECKNFSPIQR